MEEMKPPPLEYAKRGSPEKRIADPNDSPVDRWVLVIVGSVVVFAGVMYAGALIMLSWRRDLVIPWPYMVFIAVVATLLSAATAIALRPR